MHTPHRTSRRTSFLATWLLRASVLAATAFAATAPARAASAAPVAADRGMVVTAQHLATEVGAAVLRRGGNAVDAAVAVGYALAVVYPAAGNLGGGGFMTIRLADGRTTFLDFRETAPQAASADMYLDADGRVRPGASTVGHLAVAVPGTVAGLELALARYGSAKRAELLAPAIALAERGFVLDAGDAAMFAAASPALRADPASAAIFLDRGRVLGAGDRLVQRDLAATLRRIAASGSAGFYAGPVARALVASSQAGHGLITAADLEGYAARELAPVECDYRGLHVVSAPPPSSGGIVVCEILNVLEGYPLAEWGFRSARAVHVQIEAMRAAYLDRNRLLGDSSAIADPAARLLDKAYAARLRAAIDPLQASRGARAAEAAEPPREGSNTTHYSIIDAAGNAVSATVTLNDWFGAKVTAAGTGVLLNNEMDDFTVKAGAPNLYGLVQGQANRIAPGKRPLSSMSPTIVTRAGAPLMVLGTPGGSRIPTTVVHTLINVADYGMTIQEAVDAPRFHQQGLPEATLLEPFALSPDTQALLEAMGHRFAASPLANHVAAILVGAPALAAKPVPGMRYFGANDPRRNTGLAAGP